MNISERVIVHTFFEIYRIEYFNLIRLIYDSAFFVAERFSVLAQLRCAACKQLATFYKNSSFRVGNNITAVKLH